jgi:hypothetical protein
MPEEQTRPALPHERRGRLLAPAVEDRVADPGPRSDAAADHRPDKLAQILTLRENATQNAFWLMGW